LEAAVRPRHDIEQPRLIIGVEKRAGVFDGQSLNRVIRNGSVETDAATVLGQHRKMGLVVRDDAFGDAGEALKEFADVESSRQCRQQILKRVNLRPGLRASIRIDCCHVSTALYGVTTTLTS